MIASGRPLDDVHEAAGVLELAGTARDGDVEHVGAREVEVHVSLRHHLANPVERVDDVAQRGGLPIALDPRDDAVNHVVADAPLGVALQEQMLVDDDLIPSAESRVPEVQEEPVHLGS